MLKFILVGLNLINTAYAEPKSDIPEIVVEAHSDYELYVAPTVLSIHTNKVETVISEKSVFGYASSFWRNAKVKNKRGAWEPITMHSEVKVYDRDTIQYAWDNCDYLTDSKSCAYKNNHMLLETYVTVDDHQITVNMQLFSPNMTLINQSTYTTQSKVKWIKQQEVTVVQQQGMMGSQTITHMPKEELPLKWLIPTNLMNKHIHQASLMLWSGVRID